MSKITSAPIDLFEVETFDLKRCKKDKPRAATQREVLAYLRWIAGKAGLYPFDDVNLSATYATFGRCETEAKWCNETRSYSIPQYQTGSYSIPMPGRNAHRDTVTMKTLDDDGNVIASQTLPVEPKKGGVIWDRAAVHKAVGKVAKPSRGKDALPTSIVHTIGGQHFQINRGDFGTSVFYNPHDVDGVAQPAIVIGEPMQGRTEADIDAIIADQLNPPSAEIDERAENPAAETQEAIVMADDTREAVALPSGPEITPVEPVSNRDELPAPCLADQVAALAAMVEEMRGQLAALSTGTPEATTPIEEMTTEPPVSGKRERTAAHERAIRRAWKHRRESRLRRSIAEDHMRMRDHLQGELRKVSANLSIARADLAQTHKDAVRFAALAKAEGVKRRRAVILARDLQKRLNAEHRLVDRLTKAKREVVQDLMDARAEIATLKAKPHHMGQEIKPDDYQRLMRERDEARASLASDQEKLRIMRANLERGTDALDMMTERALRAENALRAVEQRQARADSPYRVNVGPVSFRAAA